MRSLVRQTAVLLLCGLATLVSAPAQTFAVDEAAPDSTVYARAMSRYYAARHAEARPLLLLAARGYESSGAVDSAALALYNYGASYAQERLTDLLSVAAADTLDPWLARLSTPLAEAFREELAGEIAYWSYDWPAAELAYRRAFRYYDTTDATAAGFAATNRRSLAYLKIASGGQDSALIYGRWSLRLAERYAPPCSRDLGYAHLGMGNFYHLGKDLERAIVHAQIGFSALDAVLPPGHPHRATTHAQLADFYVELGRFDEALAHIRQAFAYAEGADAPTRYSVANEYGEILHQLGLHHEALYWARRTRDYAVAAFGIDNPFQTAPLLGLAHSAAYAGDTAAAARYLDTASAFFATASPVMDFVRPDFHGVAGTLAQERGDLPAALAAYREAHRLALGLGDSATFALRSSLHNLANVHLGSGRADSAAAYYAQLTSVLAYVNDDAGETDIWDLDHLRLGALIATARGDRAEAARLLSEALAALGQGGATLLVRVFGLAEAAEALAREGASAEEADLLLAYAATTERALEEEYAFLGAERWTEDFVGGLRRVFTAAAFASAARAAEAKDPGAAAALRGDAVRFSDLPRALLLRRRGAEALAATQTALPDSVAERGRRLRQELVAVQHSDLAPEQLAEALAAIRTEIAAHEDLLRRGFPNYYRALANPLRLDVAALRERARRTDTRYVSLLSDTAHGRVLVTAVGSDGTSAVVTEFGPERRAAARAFKREVARGSGGAPTALATRATGLYTALLAPELATGPMPRQLVVASDGALVDLPFAALLPEAPDLETPFSAWPWLGLQTALRHLDALASEALDAAPHETVGRLRIASLAPGFQTGARGSVAVETADGKRRKLLRTPWTLALSEELGERYGATVRTRAEATEAAFAEAYGTHDVLHLGTHALLDAEAPLRSFFALAPALRTVERVPRPRYVGADGQATGGTGLAADGRLHAYELYGLAGAARLAVLPACYSGAGRFSTAEGTMSLATALRNSGCPTVVQSHWQLDDQQTSELLRHFYAALDGGASVAEALTRARRDFLAAAPAELQHPFYWAGLATVGPPVRFGESRPQRAWWLLCGVPLVGLAVLLARRRRG